MLPSIKEQRLKKCNGVVSRNSVDLQYLYSLEQLNLCDFSDLNELPPVLLNLKSLKYLEIKQCPRLSSVSNIQLPTILECLGVEHCDRTIVLVFRVRLSCIVALLRSLLYLEHLNKNRQIILNAEANSSYL